MMEVLDEQEKAKETQVTLQKDEVIEVLQTLEGLKKRLQALLKK